MRKIDNTKIAALSKSLDKSVQQYMRALGTDYGNINLFRMNFIKKFLDDVMFLNGLSGNNDFYHRYGYLIIRNMLEQLIEFLYIQKNKHLVDEYLGLKINLDTLKGKHTPVEGERLFGQKRYIKNRPSIANMSMCIEEKQNTFGSMTLYEAYCVLSERCHNSFFDSLLKDYNAISNGVPDIGLNEEQITFVDAIIARVLLEY